MLLVIHTEDSRREVAVLFSSLLSAKLDTIGQMG